MASRATRIKACELATACIAGQYLAGDLNAAKLMALCVFFENYIDLGADKTENLMHLLSQRKTKKLRIIAGGKLR